MTLTDDNRGSGSASRAHLANDAAIELLMASLPGCIACAIWDRDVGDIVAHRLRPESSDRASPDTNDDSESTRAVFATCAGFLAFPSREPMQAVVYSRGSIHVCQRPTGSRYALLVVLRDAPGLSAVLGVVGRIAARLPA